MRMPKYKQGDKIRITSKRNPHAFKTIWLIDVEEIGLVTYSGIDPTAPNVALDVLLKSEDYDVTLEVALEDALPKVPGAYQDRIREDMITLFETVGIDIPADVLAVKDKPWVLNEDGTWTSPTGETQPVEENWNLVVEGFDFFPWEERDR